MHQSMSSTRNSGELPLGYDHFLCPTSKDLTVPTSSKVAETLNKPPLPHWISAILEKLRDLFTIYRNISVISGV